MPAREEILRLIASLSDYECMHILGAFQQVAAGERFWETGVSTVYNEHVKTRSFHTADGVSAQVPAVPETAEGLYVPVPIAKVFPGATRVSLPAPGPLPSPLGDLLGARRSRRDYTGEAIAAEALSTLLDGTCGVTGTVPGYGYKRLPLRAFPSTGGLQSPEVYVCVRAVHGVPAGLYHFHVQDHALELLRAGDHGQALRSLALDQECLETASVVVVVTGCFERLRWKYGERAYKYMCMDIGYLGQNLYLVAEALGLGACAIAGFMDDALERFLALEDRNELPLLMTTVGVRSPGR
jgi:SagB-type dehydrogenase family enzyme